MDDYCIVLCTFGDNDSAKQAATLAVEQRLAACVNILPGIQSVYHWQQEVHIDEEVQVIFKTKTALCDELHELILSVHTYTTPEWLILPVQSGSNDYIQWIKSSLK